MARARDPTGKGGCDVAMREIRVDVTVQTVAALVREQFPQWGYAEVRPVRSVGTINAVFRIGDALAARFPLRLADPGETRVVLEQEARASAELAQVSPFPTPEPVALGEPGPGYPMPWAVQTWLSGTVASEAGADPGASGALRATLRRSSPRCGRPIPGGGGSRVNPAGVSSLATMRGCRRAWRAARGCWM